MPHHLSVRLRTWPLIWETLEKAPLDQPKKPWHKHGNVARAVEVCDIVGGLIFLAGSICFLPALSHKLAIFLCGCALFILGSCVYLGVSAFCLVESVTDSGWYTLEACENWLYMMANIIFLVGTVLYWPEEAHYLNIDWMKEFSLGVYFNLFTPEFEGTLLFIFGSVLYAIAAFVNGVSQGNGHTDYSGLFSATTSLYMAGSLLFVVGSFAFLPDFGITEQIVTMGAWCYIIGSALFVIGGVISLRRVSKQASNSPELKSLVPQHNADIKAARDYLSGVVGDSDLETQKESQTSKDRRSFPSVPPSPGQTFLLPGSPCYPCPDTPEFSCRGSSQPDVDPEIDMNEDDHEIIYYGLEPVLVPRRRPNADEAEPVAKPNARPWR